MRGGISNEAKLNDRPTAVSYTHLTGNLFFAIGAKQLGGGLEEQLKGFVREHTDTRLIIIDTLQKIREAGAEKYSYANDYEVITKLKRFADISGVCLLVVHHTRKQQADDKFEDVYKRQAEKRALFYCRKTTGEFLFQRLAFSMEK